MINGDILWQSMEVKSGNVVIVFWVISMFVCFSYVVLRLLLAIVESIYWYHKLYNRANLKRKAFRKLSFGQATEVFGGIRGLDVRMPKQTPERICAALVGLISTSETRKIT